MILYIQNRRKNLLYRAFSLFLAVAFASSLIAPSAVYAQVMPQAVTPLNLPVPGTMVAPGPVFTPPLIQGMTIHPENPLEFDFIVTAGDEKLRDDAFNEESKKLIKYFLASLTVPENELWVNLSPYEQDRIISENFGQTEMGRDLLAQDYLLKQLSASLMYPEEALGQKFWEKVREKARAQYGTTEIPMDTFNKIWIVPEKAVVYQHGQSVFVLESRLKIMLEEDYLVLEKNLDHIGNAQEGRKMNALTSAVVRELLIPEIEKEVNEGKTFANLRQIFNSMILATWYKKNLKEGLLGQIYVDQNKIEGVDVQDKQVKDKIYAQYVESLKKGVYNYIKEDYDPVTKTNVPRKYFSGGVVGDFSIAGGVEEVEHLTPSQAAGLIEKIGDNRQVQVRLAATTGREADANAGSHYIPGQSMQREQEGGDNIGGWGYNNFEYGHVDYGKPEIFVSKAKDGRWVLNYDRWIEGQKKEDQGEVLTEKYRSAIDELFGNKDLRENLTTEQLYAEIVKLRKFHYPELQDPLTEAVAHRASSVISVLDGLDLSQKIKTAILGDFGENIYEWSILKAEERRLDQLSENLSRWLNYPMPIDDLKDFIRNVQEKKHYVHVVGSVNSLALDLKVFGEAVLDELGNSGKVTFVVKGNDVGRIGSDSTIQDVESLLRQAGFESSRQAWSEGRFEIIASGSVIPGTDFSHPSDDFLSVLKEAKEGKAVLGIKGENNNFTAEYADYDHYRFFLSQQIETRRRTGIFWDKDEQRAPTPVVMWVPAGISMTDRWDKNIFSLQMHEARRHEDRMQDSETFDERSARYQKIRRRIDRNGNSLVEELYPEALLLPYIYAQKLKEEYEKGLEEEPELTFIKFVREERLKAFNEMATQRIENGSFVGKWYSLKGNGKDPAGGSIQEGKGHFDQDEIKGGNVIVAGGIFSPQGWNLHAIKAQDIPRGEDREGHRELVAHDYVFRTESQAHVSFNGLYFFTPTLLEIYNRYRTNHEDEVIDDVNFYLDAYGNGANESAPLYNKGYFGVKEGELVFGRRRMSGGTMTVTVNGRESVITWEEDQVVDEPNKQVDSEPAVVVFTPMMGESIEMSELSARDNNYILPVGEDRYNIIVINNQIKFIKKGPVLLPPIGIVVSLNEQKLKEIFGDDIDRYSDGRAVKDNLPEADFKFDWPGGESQRPEWYLGGGTLLVANGNNLVKDQQTEYQNFKEEGWFNKLSMQTQETQVQDWVRGPRMILGNTTDGEFFAFSFSGRSPGVTDGANFAEAVAIIEKELKGKAKSIQNAINLDGGSSVSFNVRGKDGKIYTPSWPATGPDNIQGISRPVSSIVYLIRSVSLPPTPQFGHSGNAVDGKFIEASEAIKAGDFNLALERASEAVILLAEKPFDELDNSNFPVADTINQDGVAIWVLGNLIERGLATSGMVSLLEALEEGKAGLELKIAVGYRSQDKPVLEDRHLSVHRPRIHQLLAQIGVDKLIPLLQQYRESQTANDTEGKDAAEKAINRLVDEVNVDRRLEALVDNSRFMEIYDVQISQRLAAIEKEQKGQKRRDVIQALEAEIEAALPALQDEAEQMSLKRPRVITTQEFEQSEHYQSYRQKAEETIIDGNYVPQFLFAGKATRLNRGAMYPLDIWKIAVEEDIVPVEETGEYRMGMGPRQILAYRIFIEKLARARGLDSQEVMKRQRLLFLVNDEVQQEVFDDLKAHAFYGFDPANVYFINQPEYRGHELRKNGDVLTNEKSAPLVFGHGDNIEQHAVAGDAYQIDIDGKKSILTEDILSYLGERYVASHRVNDLTKFLEEEVVNLDKLALGIYLQEQGHQIVADLVDNPGKQKGGTATNYGLIETLAVKGSPKLTALVNFFGLQSAPYNAFRLLYRADRLKKLLKENDIPYYLRFKDGFFYLEAVTGDLTQYPVANTAFIQTGGSLIHDFKETKNVPSAVDFMRKQDEQLRTAVSHGMAITDPRGEPRKSYSFSPGPAMLPASVWRAKRELMGDENRLDLSERTFARTEYNELQQRVKAKLRELMGIPENYEILLLPQPATSAYAMVARNLLARKGGGAAYYVTTGVWSKNALAAAREIAAASPVLVTVSEIASSEAAAFDHLPELDPDLFADPDRVSYVHFTWNNTVYGTRWPRLPDTNGIPMVLDATSDILSQRIAAEDWRNIGVIYAGAQKNIGLPGFSVLIVRKDLVDSGVLPGTPKNERFATWMGATEYFVTPPTDDVMTLDLVLNEFIARGGVEAMEQENRIQAQMVYDVIDNSNGFYRGLVMVPEHRSIMNVTLRLADESLTDRFHKEAEAEGLYDLKGFPEPKGGPKGMTIRASIYNGMPRDGIERLVKFMKDFQQRVLQERALGDPNIPPADVDVANVLHLIGEVLESHADDLMSDTLFGVFMKGSKEERKEGLALLERTLREKAGYYGAEANLDTPEFAVTRSRFLKTMIVLRLLAKYHRYANDPKGTVSSITPIQDVDLDAIIDSSFSLGAEDKRRISQEAAALLQDAEGDAVHPGDRQTVSDQSVGGIDLDPAMLDLQIRVDGNGIPLPLHEQPVHLMNINGFVPVIINVVPVANMPMLLGIKETPDGQEPRKAENSSDHFQFTRERFVNRVEKFARRE